ncbi:MAG: hypothetical protein KAS73_02235 [Candidatus Sabulitectum sp.]|nr:hypothetical protein [Candidatus Sabulitectum sp.]
MQDRKLQVGIDRIIQLSWLERTAFLVMAGNDKETIEDSLQDLLKDRLAGGRKGVRASREKTITVLMKVWLNVPDHLKDLQVDGLRLLQKVSKAESLAVHWGMIMAVYPFWFSVAAHTGRLLQLQESVTNAQIERRMKEQYGDRQTVTRSTQRALRSFTDWGLLTLTKGKGIYSQKNAITIQNPDVVAWLLETSLHARFKGSAPFPELINAPSLFPFQLTHISPIQLTSLSPRLERLRHGLDDDLIELMK